MKTIICLLFAGFAITNGAVEDVLGTCNLGENPCEINQYQRGLDELAENGDSSLDIPLLDPLDVKDIDVTTHDKVLEFHLITGVVKGIKSCVITNVDIDTDDLFTTLVVKCNIDVDCRYKAKATGGLGLLSTKKPIRGDGNAKISLDGLILTIYKPFYVDKEEDDYYVRCSNTNNTFGYDFDVKNRVTFDVKNVYLGTQDIGNLVTVLLNANWRYYLHQYGRDFLNEAMKNIYTDFHKVFDNIPSQNFITDIADYYDDA